MKPGSWIRCKETGKRFEVVEEKDGRIYIRNPIDGYLAVWQNDLNKNYERVEAPSKKKGFQ